MSAPDVALSFYYPFLLCDMPPPPPTHTPNLPASAHFLTTTTPPPPRPQHNTPTQAYLLEVNSSPALFRAGAYLSDLLPRVMEEVVQKAVDPWFPPGDTTGDAAGYTMGVGDTVGGASSAGGVRQESDGGGGGGVEGGRGAGSSSRLEGFELIVDGSRRALQRSSTSIGAVRPKQQVQPQQPGRKLQKQVSAPAAGGTGAAAAAAAGAKRHSVGGAATSRRASQEQVRSLADRRTSRAFVV
jgi:tubulin--tyrosine ligase